MTLGATLLASFLLTTARPAVWPLGLLGFLISGGLLLVVAPIVVLPSAVGVANVVAPALEDIAFGRRPDELAALAAGGAVIVLGWLIGGGLIAAVVEAELVREVMADDELTDLVPGPAEPSGPPTPVPGRPGTAWRIVSVRLIAHGPLVVALAWGALRIVTVAYRELTVPSDVSVPIALRVVLGTPDAVAAVVLAWLIGEAVGGMAARHVVVLGDGVAAGLRGGLRRFLRAPLRSLSISVLSSVLLALILGAEGLAAAAAWDAVRGALALDAGPVAILLIVAVFIGLFLGGLVLLAVATTWRSAVWTVDLAGTFGGCDRPDRVTDGGTTALRT